MSISKAQPARSSDPGIVTLSQALLITALLCPMQHNSAKRGNRTAHGLSMLHGMPEGYKRD